MKVFDKLIEIIAKRLPRTEMESFLEKRLQAIENMQQKLDLYEAKTSMLRHLEDDLPEIFKNELKHKIIYLCNEDYKSDNYMAVVKSLMDNVVYQKEIPQFVKKLVIFKKNIEGKIR